MDVRFQKESGTRQLPLCYGVNNSIWNLLNAIGYSISWRQLIKLHY